MQSSLRFVILSRCGCLWIVEKHAFYKQGLAKEAYLGRVVIAAMERAVVTPVFSQYFATE